MICLLTYHVPGEILDAVCTAIEFATSDVFGAIFDVSKGTSVEPKTWGLGDHEIRMQMISWGREIDGHAGWSELTVPSSHLFGDQPAYRVETVIGPAWLWRKIFSSWMMEGWLGKEMVL